MVFPILANCFRERLQVELENSDYHIVYFESSEDLEMTDVDIADVLLVIAHCVSQNLEKIKFEQPNEFNKSGVWTKFFS